MELAFFLCEGLACRHITGLFPYTPEMTASLHRMMPVSQYRGQAHERLFEKPPAVVAGAGDETTVTSMGGPL